MANHNKAVIETVCETEINGVLIKEMICYSDIFKEICETDNYVEVLIKLISNILCLQKLCNQLKILERNHQVEVKYEGKYGAKRESL